MKKLILAAVLETAAIVVLAAVILHFTLENNP